jgi:hypothetical protein
VAGRELRENHEAGLRFVDAQAGCPTTLHNLAIALDHYNESNFTGSTP